MSEENGTATQTKDALLTKINGQINEEKLSRDLGAVQLGKIKTLDEISQEMLKSSSAEEANKALEENLEEMPDSLVSRYILGAVALLKDGPQEAVHLKGLLDEFRKAAKWPIVDHIADLFLGIEENHRFALRAKVESTERLKGKKELKPYLEKLAAIDRKNPDIIKKYALSIFDEEKDKAVTSLKQAGEAYARLRDYKSVEEIWNLIVEHDHQDMPWFERIERVLVGNREKIRAAALFTNLVEPYKAEENWPLVISVLKKILEYEPASTRSRSELVRAYRAKYADHSLLDDFLKMSDLTNNKKPVGPCIANFERNIVFDNENYVYHRTRGVGKIKTITSEHLIIDFAGNPDQRMSIQMAISSLQPLGPNHIWVKYHEDAEAVTEPLSRLRDRGLRVAIDDFGTGYSSLRYLRDLPADILKIDRAFVSGSYDTELADPPIVASVIDLGHAVGLEVIAEGVETPAQLEAIQILDADVVQGFLLSRPVEFDEAMGMLSEGQPAGVASTAS